MLGGDSGRFLCFCLRRSLSFRLWGRTDDQTWVSGGSGAKRTSACASGPLSEMGPGDVVSTSGGPGRLAGREWLRQVPLRASSPFSSLPADSSPSRHHASDTAPHVCARTYRGAHWGLGAVQGGGSQLAVTRDMRDAGTRKKWADTRLECGVCGPCVGALGTLTPWEVAGGSTQTQGAPGKQALTPPSVTLVCGVSAPSQPSVASEEGREQAPRPRGHRVVGS